MKHVTHFRSLIASIALLLSSLFPSHASDIKEVLPLTNRILVVRFDDGFVRYHKAGEPRTDDQVFVDPLNTALADKTASYSIKSSNDAAYASALSPQQLWRKSKGTEFAWKCDNYADGIGCINDQLDHAKEHWVYLVLPSALQRGKTYTITTGDLAKNGSTWEITFDEKQLRSEAVHVNAVAYEADARDKYGYLYHWAGSGGGVDLSDYNGASFSLVSTASQQSVFTGKVAFRKGKNNVETFQGNDTPNQNFLGADVYECDFSSFSTPGEYTLVVDGVGRSFPFEIKKEAFFQPFYLAMKGLYQNRSGIELTRPYTDFPRPAPHNPKLTPGFSGRLKYTTTRLFDLASENADPADKAVVEAGYQGDLQDTWGWYQDAGDWDGYYTHSHIPGLLMFLYEAGGTFTDGELNIPESGNGLPDVLDEASWLLRFYQRARKEITDRGWGTGGVPGARVYGDLWGKDLGEANVQRGSWQDTDRDWYVTGEDPWISYKYAGLAAQFAYILEQLGTSDPQGIDWKEEAISAYEWAKANTRSGDEAVRFKDIKLAEIRLYASASVYRLTGEVAYHNQFLQEASLLTEGLAEGQDDKMSAIWMYLLINPSLTDAGQLSQLRTAFTKVTDDILLETPDLRACRWGGNIYMPMLVGQATTPLVTAGVYGYLDQQQQNPGKAEDYLASLYTTGDYFMGTNPLNITWITGAGDRPPAQIFHLDWWTSGREDVLPGVIPYGPWRLSDLGPVGPWNPEYGWVTAQPDIATWPGHERWFDQRSAVLGAEFTVHQNTATAAFVYGFLAKKGKRLAPLLPSDDEGTGLSYELFNNKSLAGTAVTGVHPTINFDWGRSGPEGVGADLFSFRWSGKIKVPRSGTYTFYARTDDGVRLLIDDQPIITHFKDQAARERSGTLRLEAGEEHTIVMEYYENYGRAVAELRWSGPEVEKQIVPQRYLYPSAPGSRMATESPKQSSLSSEPTLHVFPNPVVDQHIGISGKAIDPSQIEIRTMEGRVVRHRVVSSESGHLVVTPQVPQPVGLYLITVTRPGEGVQTYKLMMD